MTDTPLLHTPLHALHVARGGRMVPFAGYDMPVQYDGMGVMKEHLHTRAAAGLFDVSHMGQALLYSPTQDPALALERIVPGDIAGLGIGKQRYTMLLDDQGGIVDDLMVARLADNTLFLVVNAACKDKDIAYIRERIGTAAGLTVLNDRALLALQGPVAENALAAHLPGIVPLAFMDVLTTQWRGQDVYVSRSGYTGEDGFEISLPAALARDFAEALLEDPDVALIGLGARDSLRLEAGLCLYGHDIDETTTPVDANLKWTVPKRRRAEGGFAGADTVLRQLAEGAPRRRVGLKPQGRAPVREGAELHDDAGRLIGRVTSGGFGPTAGGPVAMGYVETAFAAAGTVVNAVVRGQALPCTVTDLPFVPHRYKKG